MLLFSSWRTFENVLGNPEMYGFRMEERKKRCGDIWVDHLHPTSAMQSIIARDVEEFLSGYPAFEDPSTGTDPNAAEAHAGATEYGDLGSKDDN